MTGEKEQTSENCENETELKAGKSGETGTGAAGRTLNRTREGDTGRDANRDAGRTSCARTRPTFRKRCGCPKAAKAESGLRD